jgi:hypothetical protein
MLKAQWTESDEGSRLRYVAAVQPGHLTAAIWFLIVALAASCSSDESMLRESSQQSLPNPLGVS